MIWFVFIGLPRVLWHIITRLAAFAALMYALYWITK